MVEVARQHQRVVQCGSQQRTTPQFRLAAELFGSGAVGTMKEIRVGIPSVNFRPPPVPDSDPPATLDYDLWLGPAPYRPYNEKRVHYLFRFFWDYSGGQMTNFGAHDLDIAQLALGMDESGPSRVSGTAEFHPEGWYEVPNRCRITYEYANGVKVLLGQEQPDVKSGITFVGSEGSIYVTRSKFVSDPPEVVERAVKEARDHAGIQDGDGRPPSELDRLHPIGRAAERGCRNRASLGDRLPLGEHRRAYRQVDRVGSTRESITNDASAAEMLTRPYRVALEAVRRDRRVALANGRRKAK